MTQNNMRTTEMGVDSTDLVPAEKNAGHHNAALVDVQFPPNSGVGPGLRTQKSGGIRTYGIIV